MITISVATNFASG